MKSRNCLVLMICIGFGITSAQAALNYDPSLPAPAPVKGAGWVSDQINAADTNSLDSPYVYNLSVPAKFRITDQFITGDHYKVYDFGVLICETSPGIVGIPFGDDVFADAGWANPAYQKAECKLSAGPHSLTIQGDGAGGIPAGFYTRLDSEPGKVPAVTAWGMAALILVLLTGVAVKFGRRQMKSVTG